MLACKRSAFFFSVADMAKNAFIFRAILTERNPAFLLDGFLMQLYNLYKHEKDSRRCFCKKGWKKVENFSIFSKNVL